MSKHRLVRLLLPVALVALLIAADPALQPAEAVDLQAAWDDLAELKRSTKSKASNDDLDQYLDAVFNAYKGLDAPPAPPEDAAEEEKKKYASDLAKFEKEQEKFRSAAEKLFLKVLVLVKVKNETNLRDDMNTKAARILGDLGPMLDEKGRKSLSKKIMQAIEKKLTKVKTHTVSTDHLDAAFQALGKLNDFGSIEWIIKNYTHTKDNEKEYLVAAHKAIVLFKNVPGKLRYAVVEQFVKTYAGVESQAEKSSNDPKDQAKKRFWDDIKTGVIPVVQYFTKDSEGNPASDPEGQALAKMAEFQAWMREHKSIRKSPWTDPKPTKGKKK